VIGKTIDRQRAAAVKASPAAAASIPVARTKTADGSKDAINTESLLERCMNNAQIARKVLSRFQKSAEDTVVRLEQALDSDDVSQAAIHAHTLKGAAASVSAEPLSKAAAEIEQQCKVAATAAARTTLLTLRLELKRCLDSMPGAMDRLAQAVGS
jgi:HPt (histidine-containing phosphotransfer) domain-containing protein